MTVPGPKGATCATPARSTLRHTLINLGALTLAAADGLQLENWTIGTMTTVSAYDNTARIGCARVATRAQEH